MDVIHLVDYEKMIEIHKMNAAETRRLERMGNQKRDRTGDRFATHYPFMVKDENGEKHNQKS